VAAPGNSEAVRDYVSHVALYRQDFRRYLRNLDWAQSWRSASFSTEDGLAHDARTLTRLHEAGWNRYGWPQSAGGLGGDEIHSALYYEELAYAMLPGAIGLTAEHDLHRYVARGFQIDALCGSYHQLEVLLAERLFEIYSPGRALPAIIAWG
jgi:alkylation response protein AidB-like acyl-CoA dehydrogenase